MNAQRAPLKSAARLAFALLLLWLSACAAVRVHEAPRDAYFAAARESILTGRGLSQASRQTLLATGLDERACLGAPGPCDAQLASAPDRESALATMAELQLLLAQAAERSRNQRGEALAHYAQAARLAYADLFFARPAMHACVCDDRTMQVRDFYNHATERLVSLLYEDVGKHAPVDAATALPVPGWQVTLGRIGVRLPHGQVQPSELVPASRLRFKGLRSTFRRNGLGADFVAVAAHDEASSEAGDESLREPHYLAATVLLRFAGNTLDEVLATHAAAIDVYDPYQDETVAAGAQSVALSANFTAPYALWLSRSRFGRAADRALFARSSGLAAPRIYLLQPYDPQRRTLVLLHGLHSSPEAWINLANEIMGDDTLRRRYQVWQVFYPTNLPIAENRHTIREALLAAQAQLDPTHAQPASHLTLIGHSMGGVLARLLVVESGDQLWNSFFHKPLEPAERERLALLEPYLSLHPLPQVERTIFLAAPHRGSPVARGWLGRAASRLIRLPATALHTIAAVADAIQFDAPDQAAALRARNMDSVENLSDQGRYLQVTATLPIAPGVAYHSIVGRKDPAIALEDSTDGAVPYRSAHLDGATSELVVTSDHSVQETPAAILEIRRILRAALAAGPMQAPTSAGPTP